jgi:hypothetical protein
MALEPDKLLVLNSVLHGPRYRYKTAKQIRCNEDDRYGDIAA